MKRVECTQCEKTFTKGSVKSAEQALLMHVGRVHTGKINNARRGFVTRGNNGHEALSLEHDHEHEHNHEPEMKQKRASKLSRDERDSVVSFIREHHGEYTTKAACFREAMKAAGATGKIKENSVAVSRHFDFALARKKPAAIVPAPKPKRQFYRGDIVDNVLAHHASPVLAKNDCPNCHYDFNLLSSSKVPARYCPGCGTTIQTLINQLLSLLTP